MCTYSGGTFYHSLVRTGGSESTAYPEIRWNCASESSAIRRAALATRRVDSLDRNANLENLPSSRRLTDCHVYNPCSDSSRSINERLSEMLTNEDKLAALSVPWLARVSIPCSPAQADTLTALRVGKRIAKMVRRQGDLCADSLPTLEKGCHLLVMESGRTRVRRVR